MRYRLLVDLDVVTALQALPQRLRERLVQHFKSLREAPEGLSEGARYDSSGRRTEISMCSGFAVHYWVDAADRHVKILELRPHRGSMRR